MHANSENDSFVSVVVLVNEDLLLNSQGSVAYDYLKFWGE